MRTARHRWLAVVFFTALILATRLPLAPGQLFTFDDVNLAYSIGHFDIRVSQPQPPGYPLFVMEMRALSWLRFRRVENILLTLALLGSIAALLLLVATGNRIMGRQAGFYGALLLALNPVFWHSGIVSALRIQLAIASLAVAASCWRAWEGDRFWVPRSAIVLGLAAGIRPEIGPLLFPLWAVSAWRARVKWEDLRFALGAMTIAVLAWLAPAMWASGGPAGYVKACIDYLSDQASVTSGLFGSEHAYATFWHLVVWTLAILPACVLPAVLAWRCGWGIRRSRFAFLALWFAPPFAFACFVHLEDPGQALGMTVVVALFGGYLIQRALDEIGARISRWHALFFAAATLTEAWIVDRHDAPFIVIWTPVLALALGLLLKFDRTKTQANPPRLAAALFLLAPVALLNLTMFNHQGWYYRGPGWGRRNPRRPQQRPRAHVARTHQEHTRHRRSRYPRCAASCRGAPGRGLRDLGTRPRNLAQAGILRARDIHSRLGTSSYPQRLARGSRALERRSAASGFESARGGAGGRAHRVAAQSANRIL